jgi:PIN domain nuclease of toxin-antitoxin system
MRLLLDTHVFLWFILRDTRLSAHWRTTLRDPSNAVFLSAVSIWEACVKYHLGKLPLPEDPSVYLPAQRIAHHFNAMPLSEECLRHLQHLPPIHKDPFDRMLLCQAIENQCQLLTDDTALLAYSTPVLSI